MIYKFKSKATGDVIMLGPQGDQLLRLLGREPAPKGIIEVATMPAAIAALEAAVVAEEARPPAAEAADGGDGDEPAPERRISLRRRVWPMVEMMKRASAEGHPIVWGV
jgi:hypothetical protein